MAGAKAAAMFLTQHALCSCSANALTLTSFTCLGRVSYSELELPISNEHSSSQIWLQASPIWATLQLRVPQLTLGSVKLTSEAN